jgi:hypothetical protein
MAFNALYNAVRTGGESESTAVGKVVTLFVDQTAAMAVLAKIGSSHIHALVSLPPGDDRYPPSDARYRTKSKELLALYTASANPVERLATLMQIVYQVRCNLLHGSKDPTVLRDQELVAACTPILAALVPTLQSLMESHHQLPRPA